MNELKYFRRNRVVEEYPISSHVLQIKVDDIRPNRAQPRADFDNNSIIRLADSIRRYGIIQPLTVRKSDEDDIYAYELVAGERRLRAARMLGYFTVPCIVIEADERMSAEMAIIENLLRKDLNMFEQAYGFKRLIENHGLTQDEVARRMSMSQSAVANKIRLLRLSDAEQRLILESELLRIESEKDRIEAIRHIVSFSLNVVNTEQYIDLLLKRAKTPENNEKVSISGELEREKAAKNLVEQIKRKISGMNKQGHEATVRVGGDAENIEVVIRIARV